MVHRHEGPVRDYAGNADGLWVSGRGRRTSDQIFNSSGVEELDIWKREDTREKRRGKERLR